MQHRLFVDVALRQSRPEYAPLASTDLVRPNGAFVARRGYCVVIVEVPERHNKVVTDCWHRRAGRPDPRWSALNCQQNCDYRRHPGEERFQHRDYRCDLGAKMATSGRISSDLVFHPPFEGLPVGVGPCG